MEKWHFNLKRFVIGQSGHLRDRPGNIDPDCHIPHVTTKVIPIANNVLS